VSGCFCRLGTHGLQITDSMSLHSLVANIIAGELVEPLRRTAVFGMLQGCIMLGQGLGYLGKPNPHH
jgi:hypothetical protein